MLIKLDKNFMVNTDTIHSLEIEANGFHVTLYYGNDEHWTWSYNNYVNETGKQLAQDKFDVVSDMLEKVINLKVDKNGAFLCSHCGAPNDGN